MAVDMEAEAEQYANAVGPEEKAREEPREGEDLASWYTYT